MKVDDTQRKDAEMFAIDREGEIISELEVCSFSQEGFKERYDLQKWLAKNPKALGEDLLIISQEFDEWQETNERLDLLAMDKNGSLVVIENKLDDSGKDVVWQALRYVAYCSTLKKSKIVQMYADYHKDKSNDISEEDADRAISEFVLDDAKINTEGSQRLMLVAANFRKEVTSTVLWLLSKGIDAQCMKTTLFRHKDAFFLDIRQIIPPPEAKDYMIEASEKRKEEKLTTRGNQVNYDFWTKVLDYFHEKQLELYQEVKSPSKDNWISASAGVSVCDYVCRRQPKQVQVEFYIYKSGWTKEKTEEVFNFFENRIEEIEERFGEELKWDRAKGKKRCRVYLARPVENYDNEEQEIIEWLYDHTRKLENAFAPLIDDLKTDGDKRRVNF